VSELNGVPARARARGELSPGAWVYIAGISLAAAVAVVVAARIGAGGTSALGLTIGLAVAATVAQLSEVRTPNNKGYVATIAFLMAGALLLPPVDAAAVVPLPFVVEFLVKSKPAYIQAFNIASQILCTLAAGMSYRLVAGVGVGTRITGDPRSVVGILLALAIFLTVNHATVAVAVWLARGVRPKTSGLFSPDSLVPDLGLLATGVVIAGLWALAPALVAFAALPIVLLQRALHFPALRQASRTDPKTGLANAAWFTEQADAELRRAARLGHPVSVLVADLDLLRNINNAYGHLAGDAVLRGVADVLRREVREYDIPSRFGGEEFAILLPGSDGPEALAVAERIRSQVGREPFDVATSVEPLHVTVSVGVAVMGEHGDTLRELMHAADLALYRAKVEGRDRVRAARAGEQAAAPGAALALAVPVAPTARLLAPRQLPIGPDPVTATPAGPGGPEVDGAPLDPTIWGSANPDPSTEPATRGRRATWPVTVAVALAAATVGTLVSLAHPAITIALIVFPLLAVGAEQLRENVYGSSIVSLSAVPLLAAAAAGQELAAVVGAVVAGLGQAVTHRGKRRLEQHVFNVANITLAASSAAAIRLAVTLTGSPGHQLPELLPLAIGMGVTFFLLDNGLVALVVARDDGRRTVEVFRHDFGWLAPHFVAYGLLAALLGAAWDSFGVWGIAVFLIPLVLLRVAQRQYLARTTGHVRELRRLADDLVVSKAAVEASNEKLQTALTSVSEAHRRTAAALAGAIDARDAITGGHIERVTALGLALCELVDPELAADPQVAFGFLLHDVGKIGVPDSALLKQGPLGPAELEIMRRHPEIGERLVTAAGFADVTRQIVVTHHERWDGGGYPRGLSGTEIPLCSRLFAVADAMDAMVSDRPYRDGLPLEQAYAELSAGSGSQFDPMAVEAVLALDPTRVSALLRLSPDRLLRGSVGSRRP